MREKRADRLIDLKEVKMLVGCGKTKIYGDMAKNLFPQKRKNGRKSVWSWCEVQDHVATILDRAVDVEAGYPLVTVAIEGTSEVVPKKPALDANQGVAMKT